MNIRSVIGRLAPTANEPRVSSCGSCAAPSLAAELEATQAALCMIRAECESVNACMQGVRAATPSAWKLVPRNRRHVETLTFYEAAEALAHAREFDCDIVPLYEAPMPADRERRLLEAARQCVAAFAGATRVDGALATMPGAAVRRLGLVVQEYDDE